MKFTRDEIRASMLLYAVTDRAWLGERTLPDVVEEVLANGATFLQVREKGMEHDAFLAEAKILKEQAARYRVPFVVNDSVEVALACDADGVHVGQSDIQGRDIRALIGPDRILGISANTVDTAVAAQKAGADYIGVGAVFGTTTKRDARNLSVAQLKEICNAVDIPVVAIPGPCALITALAVSGLPTGRFTFEGFLAMNKKNRRAHLAELAGERRTMIFYEAPHKLPATLADLAETFGPDRPVSLCRELTKLHEEIIRTTLGEAAKRYQTEPPKGEFVLVVRGAEPREEPEVTLEDGLDRVRILREEEGLSLRDAVKRAAKELGLSRNELYRLAVED